VDGKTPVEAQSSTKEKNQGRSAVGKKHPRPISKKKHLEEGKREALAGDDLRASLVSCSNL